MNFSAIIGLILGGTVLFASLHESGMPVTYFLNFHGIVIVCGGTLAAATISFPIKKLLILLKIFFLRVLGGRKPNYTLTIEQILELNKKAALGLSALNDSVPNLKNEFLKEAVQLVASGVLTESELRSTLEFRVKTIEAQYMEEAEMFGSIARFPPAFGLLATTLGMISLLQQLGKPGAEKLIGPAMSIGLIGTLYGISLSNFVLLPIAEHLKECTREEIALRKMILEGALLLKSQVNPITMRETLNSFLLPKDRVLRKAA